MSQPKLKDVMLELFDHLLAEKDRQSVKKDHRIVLLSKKFYTLIESQNQIRLDIDSWLAKEHQWNKERQCL